MISPLHGVLLLDKPLGLSSNQALQKVKHLLKAPKAGHTGSLDPLATGLLPICLGEASKFSSFGLNANKSYEAVMKLGVTTSTADSEGEVVAEHLVPSLSCEQLHAISQQFVGDYEQIPPMYSALKHRGVPLYKLARQGKVIERKSRLVSIYDLQLKLIDSQHVHFTVNCSKGTYVRTLAEDMAKALGCGGAHLTRLRRTALGDLTAPMINLCDLESCDKQKFLKETLLPLDIFLTNLPAVKIDLKMTQDFLQGKKIFISADQVKFTATSEENILRCYSEEKVFLGIGVMDALGYLQPKRLISSEYLYQAQN